MIRVNRLIRTNLLVALCLLVAACGTQRYAPSKDRASPSLDEEITQAMGEGRPLAAIRLLDKHMADAPPKLKFELQIQASEILFDSGYPELAANRLNQLPADQVHSELEDRKKILQAQAWLYQSQPDLALATLPNFSGAMQQSTQVRLLETRARGFTQTNQLSKALLDRQALSSLLSGNPEAQTSNYDKIWALLSKQSDEVLLMQKAQHQNTELIGWIKFALAINAARRERIDLAEEYQNWAAFHPGHPLVSSYGQLLLEKISRTAPQPRMITLLLPLSGPVAPSSHAVRDGFLAAYFADSQNPSRPTVVIQDTGTDPSAIWQYYNQAIENGAEHIVGPLQKQAVTLLSAPPKLPVPTLALNYSQDQASNLPEGMTQFGLLPEDEGRQIAEHTIQEQLTHAVLLLENTDWAKRVAESFTQHYRALGGTVLKQGRFNPGTSDFSAPIRGTLNITESLARHRQLENTLGTKLEFIPTRRQDTDLILLVAAPIEARQIMPQLKFHYAGDIPTFSSSHAFSGEVDADVDRDLNGLIFIDIPWHTGSSKEDPLFTQIKKRWPDAHRYTRLYALGIDAYQLLPNIETLKSSSDAFFDGRSGKLFLDASGRIHRKLSQAEFSDGSPTPRQIPNQPASLTEKQE